MPKINKHKTLLRSLAYGMPNTRKTTWAGGAAEAGLNVIFLDCDDGTKILNNYDATVQSRIDVIDIRDTATEAICAVSLVNILASQKNAKPIFWNETLRGTAMLKPVGSPYYEINLAKLSSSDVIVLDSWTAMCESLVKQYNIENKVDETKGAKQDWEGYRWAGAMANWILGQLCSLSCHVVVIGHASVFEKKRDEIDHKGKVRSVTDFSRIQPASVSNNHGLKLAKEFDDVLYFLVNENGNTVIDISPSDSRDGGCRGLPPRKWQFMGMSEAHNLTYSRLLKAYGWDGLVTKPCEAFVYHDK